MNKHNNGRNTVESPKDNTFSAQVAEKSQDLNNFLQTDDEQVISPTELLKRYEYLQITDSTDVPDPIPIVKVAGQMMCTQGNITTISGASKSGKSAFTSVLIAGAIAPGEYEGFQDVEVLPNNDRKAIAHFDTEQARNKHKRNLCTIIDRAGLKSCPDFLLSYNIRQLNLSQYKAVTSEILEAANIVHGGIYLIVVDGIADYVKDVNDPESSNAIVAYFEKIAVKYDCPVIAIVHTNPNSNKERGHLGSQLQRKSETVLTVTTDNDISTLQPKFLRNAGKGDIPLIQFRYDPEKHYHVYCGIMTKEQANRDRERVAEIADVIKDVFSGQKAFSYGEAVEAIMKVSNKKERTAKDYFKEAKAHGFILQGEDKNYRLKQD